MSEAQAQPTNGAAPQEAEPAQEAAPEVVYRRPRSVPDNIRAAVDGLEAKPEAEKPAEAKPNGKPEAKPEEPAKPVEQPDSLSRQHAALTRRAKAIEQAEARAKESVAAAEAKAKEYEAKIAELEALDEMAILQRVAERKGLTLDQLVKRGIARVANKGQLPPDEQTRADIEAVRRKAEQAAAELEQLKKEREQTAEQAREQEVSATIEGWKLQAARAAQANEDRLPLLTSLDPAEIGERAYDVMSRFYEATKAETGQGIVASHEDVLLYLEQQELEDFQRKEERRKKLQSPPAATEPEGADPEADSSEQKRPARTLSNRDASERASSRKRPMTEQERIAYAAGAIPD